MRLVRYDALKPTKEQRRGFSCGEPSLDRWLATQAGQSMVSRDAVTYLLVDDEADGEPVAGYFCVSSGSVARAAMPEVARAAMPEELAKRAAEPVPIIRMGRFAVDTRHQGEGWGADLLAEALLSAVHGATLIGGRALLVDAINEGAAAFYRRYGFVASPIHPMQLFKGLDDVRLSADGGGKVSAARRVMHGPEEVLHFIQAGTRIRF